MVIGIAACGGKHRDAASVLATGRAPALPDGLAFDMTPAQARAAAATS